MSSLPADAAKASPRSSVSTGREPIVRDYASLGGPASRPIQDSQGNAPSVPSDATARPQLNLIADSDASGYHVS